MINKISPLLAATASEASSGMFFLYFKYVIIFCVAFKSLSNFFYIFFLSREGGGTLPQNSYKPFLGSMRSYPVRNNPIVSAVCEILRYKHTNRQTNILLLYYKDITKLRG